MKKIFSIMLVLGFVALSTPSFATMEQAKGGVKDILKSPLQIRDHVKEEMDHAKFVPFGVVGGFLKGTFYMGKQIVTGTYDLVTSPLSK